ISQRVLYEARCSVRIARASEHNPDAPMRVLIGVDSSADSNAAVNAVCSRHWPKGTEVGLLAVVDTVMPFSSSPSAAPAMKWIEVQNERSGNRERKFFEPGEKRIRGGGLKGDFLISRGIPADEILEEANSWGAECIFVGAKGTRGIERLLL